MDFFRRHLCRVDLLSLLFPAAMLCGSPSIASDQPQNDLREIRVGMAVSELPGTGYVNFACARQPERRLTGWAQWRDCPAAEDGAHQINFGYDPATDRDGTMVAGHPVVLTLSIDDGGRVAGLLIETDPKARLYIRKKAFLLGVQAKLRYGDEGWRCSAQQPSNGEQPVGGVYLNEACSKSIAARDLSVERKLFRRPDQDAKSFVDETRIIIQRSRVEGRPIATHNQ